MADQAIVDVNWLQKHLVDVVVLDVRYSPKEQQYGRDAYEKGHIPGAQFVDFKLALTAPAQQYGGRSPLPSPEQLAFTFSQLGIDERSIVVVYEDTNGPAASRLWWALRYIGLDRVFVLDGGITAWEEAGFALSTEEPQVEAKILELQLRDNWLANVQDVRAAIADGSAVLIDSRDRSQYVGETSPFDPVAGHIPTARHYFWKEALNKQERWLSADLLQQRFGELKPAGNYIVYCGSGISATPNVLALRQAGFENVRLYAGSWSDWISYEGNPVAVGDEEKAEKE
ncbi:sulfurtransferase [Paenibacillus sp. GXUN7292]|uniref:sulfurtransferase n=1 Tax=Paenibacillus sp. GXUN7292 TaxID=3422499 RepID=UPI003D7D6D10